MKEIYLAGGCFWGTEHFLKQINGVMTTQVGYANGITERPTYKDVCSNTTQFAETVRVSYDPTMLSLDFLLSLYFAAIDPTSLNKQGEDCGTQYRTGIYYTDETDVKTIQKVYAELQTHYKQPLQVEVKPLKNFYIAEEYHQNYLEKNPQGYCHLPQSLFEYARKANGKKAKNG